MAHQTTIQLNSCRFTAIQTPLLEHGAISASLFRYPTGVDAVRVTNARGQLVFLPYQGQQIWSMEFDGRSLGMKSIFDEPQQTQEFIGTYGAFLLHCGLLGMGHPGPTDTHAVHGELPNAPFQEAFLGAGADEKGNYLELGGTYRHARAFTCDYLAQPLIRLYENATTVEITLEIVNQRAAPMEYLYLAHVNFNPVDHARLVYSAPGRGAEVFQDKEHPQTTPQYAAFMKKLTKNPALLDSLEPDLPLDPETVMYYFDYQADRDGWAHSLHVEPDGYAGYIKHRPAELDKVIRWIVRNGSENALGVALPATATPEGFTKEKAKGHIRVLAPHARTAFHMEAGLLPPDQTSAMETHIADILAQAPK
jgi:hypothetical protein